jgi:hypothetical protein
VRTGAVGSRFVAAVALAAGVAAVSATAAEAKGPNVASVCGAARCITIDGETAVWPFLAWQYVPFSARRAPAPAPYYSIRLHEPTGIRWVLLYVPRRHVVRFWQSRVPPYSQGIGPYWRTLPASAERVFRRVVRGLAPRAAPDNWRL